MGKECKKLTLEEKVLLTCGDGSWHTHSVGDIPAVMMTDGPHGLRKQSDVATGINDSVKATCFPTACAVASSWNVQNAAKIACGIAEEAISQDVSIVLGPGVNIKRSPLCGRNFEYFSEDPFLAGQMASSYVLSMQKKGVGSCLKHFAVNSQETRRMTVDAIVDERALREIYLSAFENVVKSANPYAIMASYNKVNGSSATQNKHLQKILRDEWKYDGVVMSDWGASYDTAKAIEAGMDLEMPEEKSGFHRQLVIDAVKNGSLDEKYLDVACSRIEKLVEKCTTATKVVTNDVENHHKLCREVAADSAVLLKNQGILPINPDSDYCVIGELAEKPRYQGAGSSHINAQCKNFLQVTSCSHYAKGYTVDTDKINPKLQQQAVQLAKSHKVVLFFGGLTDIYEGEGYDRKTLDIPKNQIALLEEIYKVNPNIVFVAFGGSPFTMPWLDKVQSLLNMYLGGQAVMEAAADLVFGRVSPSGRLAETYPLKLSDTPCYNYFANDRYFDQHRESIFVGYRYYNTFDVPVLFPFGFGLSYGRFEYSDLTVTKSDKGFDVSVKVSNMGDIAAAEVVQLYVDNCKGNFVRAKRELRAFEKVYLQPNQSQTVNFRLSERDFAIYRDGFVAINGNYGISVCKNVRETILTQQVEVTFGVTDITDDRQRLSDYFSVSKDGFVVSDNQFELLTGWKRPNVVSPIRGQFTLLNTFEDMYGKVGLIRLVYCAVKSRAKKEAPTKSLSDPVAQMILSGAMETPLISIMSVGGIHSKYVNFLLLWANKQYFQALKTLCKSTTKKSK